MKVLLNRCCAALVVCLALPALGQEMVRPFRPVAPKQEYQPRVSKTPLTEEEKDVQAKAKATYEKQETERVLNSQVDPGVLKQAALSAGKGSPTLDLQLAQYYFQYGKDLYMPFSIGTALPANSKLDKDTVIDSLLSYKGGLLFVGLTPANTKGEVFRRLEGPKGLCEFDADSPNGCFSWYRLGIKVAETPKNATENTQFVAGYVGAGLNFHFPVFERPDKTDPVGLVATGLSLNGNVVDAKKLDFVMGERVKSAFMTLDASLKFQIAKVISFSAGGTLANSDHRIGRRAFITLALEN